ncbi:MAG: adenylate/guanylate cyclase domain-containing protein [Desulfohalobiaceae bacterium]
MRLSLKIFLLMFGVAFIVSGATGSYFYFQAKQTMLRAIQDQLRTASQTSASSISGDDLQLLTRQEQVISPAYKRVQDVLWDITQTNSDFLYAYTMRLKDGEVRFVVDSPPSDDNQDGVISEDELPAPIGEKYPNPPQTLLQGFVQPSVDDQLYQDQWGWTISGYAPIQDSQGRNVGLLGIDMSAARMEAKLAEIKRAGLISLGVSFLLALCFTWFLSKSMARPIHALQNAFRRVGEGDLEARVPENGKDELARLSRDFNQLVQELKEKELLKASLGKVMHREAVNRLLNNELQLGGETITASILFCDLRGFTAISEKLPPKVLVGLLNDYFSAMVKVVEAHGGMLDKFVGDKVMAVFGYDQHGPESRAKSLQAGLEMLAECDRLNSSLGLKQDMQLVNSIGIHSGQVLAGNIGSQERMEYTVIGDAVNIAAKLEGLSRQLNTRLVVSQEALQGVSPLPENLQNAGLHRVPGRAEELEVFILQ